MDKSEFTSLKNRIRELCKQKRIRLKEFMRTFDIHNQKKITPTQFARALDTSGLNLTSNEVQILTTKYALSSYPISIDYQKFCDHIDKACQIKGLEAKPMTNFQSKQVQVNEPTCHLTELELEELRLVNERLSAVVLSKGYVIKDFFKDFDRKNAGVVTKDQFLRNLVILFPNLSLKEMELLKKVHSDGPIDCNYKSLHRDLTRCLTPSTTNSSSCAEASLNNNNNNEKFVDIMDIQEKLKLIVCRERIRVKSFFADFDRIRSGKCTLYQFRRGIKSCFNKIMSYEVEALIEKYGPEEGMRGPETMINYSKMCEDLEGTSIKRGESAIIGSHSINSSTKFTRNSLSSHEEELFNSVMDKMYESVTTRRILLKPIFQDFDKRRENTVTFAQFYRALAMVNLLSSRDDEKLVLVKSYRVNNSFIHYHSFYTDLLSWKGNNVEEILQNPLKKDLPNGLCKTNDGGPPKRSFPMLMRYIKTKTKKDRIRLDESFRDNDSLRKGKITRRQFAGAMNTNSFVLSASEINVIADEYVFRTEDSFDIEKDICGQPYFAWRTFFKDVDSVFNTSDPTDSCTDSDITNQNHLTAVENEELMIVLRIMQEKIFRKRLELKPSFEDFDPVNRGYISSTKFERVLSIFQLLPEIGSLKIVFKKFKDDNDSVSCEDINYKAFLNALNEISKNKNVTYIPGTYSYRKIQETNKTNQMEKPNIGGGINELSNSICLDDLLSSINSQLQFKRIRLKEFIMDGDKLRSGEISKAKFLTALNRASLDLSKAEIECLCCSFVSFKSKEKINWRNFLAEIDANNNQSVLNKNGLESNSMNCTSNSEVRQQVGEILEKVREGVSMKRLLLKPYFQDYDRNHIHKVTKGQFAAVLDMMKLNLSIKELHLLSIEFAASTDNRKRSKDVDYEKFIQRVDAEYNSTKD